MKLLDSFFKLRKEIHDYFGYTEDWVTIPLMDGTGYYWNLRKRPDSDLYKDVRYHEEPLTKETLEGGATYSAVIYTQRFLSKWVYRTEDYTMICVDTQTDGNKYLMVFDNSKECKGVDEYEYNHGL